MILKLYFLTQFQTCCKREKEGYGAKLIFEILKDAKLTWKDKNAQMWYYIAIEEKSITYNELSLALLVIITMTFIAYGPLRVNETNLIKLCI